MTNSTLLVQDYLRSGKTLNQLKIEHGINFNIQNGKIALNYDQIEAKNSDVLAQQCRGLVLREGAFDVIAAPMFRFFNMTQEGAATIDWESAVIEDKLDGSCLIISYDSEIKGWCCGTRSRAEADVSLDGSNFTFTSLTNYVCSRLFNKDINQLMNQGGEAIRHKTFVFELCSPMNQIVCAYPDLKFVLLAVRDNITLKEELPKPYAEMLGVPIVQTYSFENIEKLLELVESWNPLEHEGVIVKDKHFNRLKIKNKMYLLANMSRDSLMKSPRAIFDALLLHQDDDLMAILPDFITERMVKCKEVLIKMLTQVNKEYQEVKDIEPMKEFAFAVKDKLWPAACFNIKRGKCIDLNDFIMKQKNEVGGFPHSTLDTVIELCLKIEPTMLDWKLNVNTLANL